MNAAVSVIIVNYNAGNLLSNCVHSLLRYPLDIEIIIIDNASTDQSLDVIPESAQIRIFRNPVNAGFATACNIGIRLARAPRLLFLNPDCRFECCPLPTLIDALDSDHSIGMVGALLLNEDGTEQQGARRAIPTPWRSFVRAFGLHRLSRHWPELFFSLISISIISPCPNTPLKSRRFPAPACSSSEQP